MEPPSVSVASRNPGTSPRRSRVLRAREALFDSQSVQQLAHRLQKTGR